MPAAGSIAPSNHGLIGIGPAAPGTYPVASRCFGTAASSRNDDRIPSGSKIRVAR